MYWPLALRSFFGISFLVVIIAHSFFAGLEINFGVHLCDIFLFGCLSLDHGRPAGCNFIREMRIFVDRQNDHFSCHRDRCRITFYICLTFSNLWFNSIEMFIWLIIGYI